MLQMGLRLRRGRSERSIMEIIGGERGWHIAAIDTLSPGDFTAWLEHE